MKVFLTGASGGIGLKVLETLVSEGFDVAYLSRSEQDLPWGVKIKGDLTDVPAIEENFAKFKPDTVIHLGWVGVDKNEKGSLSQIVNIDATVDLLSLAVKYSVKSFIGMGSESEYGVHNKKIDENAAVMPLTKYARAKLAAGLLAQKMCADNDIKFVWLRLFSSYGPGDRKGSLMSLLINSLMGNSALDLSKCEQVWDYVFVDDIAALISKIAKNPGDGGFFNLGGGHATVLKSIVDKIRLKINPQGVLNFGAIPYGKNQLMHLEADISKLAKVYGWTPQTSLEEGLEKTIQWNLKRKHQNREL